MLIDPQLLLEHWFPVTVITIGVVLGQSLTCAFGTFVAGNDTRTSLRVGMGLAQIGEFSFIIAALGLSLKVTSEFLYPIAVAVSAVTTLLNPYLIKNANRLVGWFDRFAPPKLISHLSLYTRWVGQLGNDRGAHPAALLARRWVAQIALNASLVAAILIAAALVSRHPTIWLEQFRFGAETLKAGLWLAAMIVSLPLLIATIRNWKPWAC